MSRSWYDGLFSDADDALGHALSLLEGQKRPVSDIELAALADILNVSADWLLGREK